ncbi:sodium:alanine symporter family protein [Neisseria gonorrhoeae]|uniref:alanine/glycine:cation symporter family protein n=1 Tax=Neisseria gonorrhoeae TaxID=485 RepID=UPI0005DCADA6|nr:sodium:alanine symporter family protein [Neisseria gonorrhoeae]ANJ52477.1 alanine glycine permease [Neisseria gonorrhoeae]KLR84961.1 alanine glycine permease [Neisseria gonorrhoeae SK15454]KLS42474.1 alanine glycine permease [Neisseria gonorrhoeae SK39420]KLS54152.1 alanine glycine permease [Neisseria gonorrhoeae ATL_2011_05-08]KLS94917.1 alanine glycine permease [Neisseria gonorrhoeae MU_NG23]
MENILSVLVGTVNRFLWGYLLIYALLGIGLFFTLYLGAPQITKLGAGFKSVFGGLFAKGDKDDKSLSQFQALAVAISAQIGTGNVAGVATAITAGGPGAIFWMWLSAVLGMSTIFAEALLAQKYRVVSHGKYIGGPAFYITHGLTPKIGRGAARFLSGFFSIALIVALGFIGNATQANSIASAVTIAFDVPSLAVGIVFAVLAGMVVIGGVNRIANIARFVVPFMAVVYILCAVVILFEFSDHIVPMFNHIFTAAFNPEAVLGGAAGIGMREAIRFGVARGLFSNEAGMGSTPHAHATADVKHPVQQGMTAFVGVFIDTILVCTATALIILLTDANLSGEQGAAVTQFAFNKVFPGFGSQLLAVCLTFFAFTTIIGWYYFGESNIRFLFRGRHLGIYRALVLLAIVLGTLGKVDLVWNLSDMFNGFMVIPNLIALFLLRKEIRAIYDDYLMRKKAGQDLSYQYEFHEFHDKQ